MNPKISIIVPVYKVEQYIHKCIDSILKQTFKDFELILVDDGSLIVVVRFVIGMRFKIAGLK